MKIMKIVNSILLIKESQFLKLLLHHILQYQFCLIELMNLFFYLK